MFFQEGFLTTVFSVFFYILKGLTALFIVENLVWTYYFKSNCFFYFFVPQISHYYFKVIVVVIIETLRAITCLLCTGNCFKILGYIILYNSHNAYLSDVETDTLPKTTQLANDWMEFKTQAGQLQKTCTEPLLYCLFKCTAYIVMF